MSARVAYDSMDLLQAAHTMSGVEMAMWDLLGRAKGAPVWSLLGYRTSHAKTPYASRLFGDTPQETLEIGRLSRRQGFRAAKFGWGPIGRGTASEDADHFMAAREGLGADGILLVDVGQIFIEDVERAAERLPAQQTEAATASWPLQRAAGEPPARPLRLFEPPEPIEALAEVPDGPPARFRWRRVLHDVTHAEGPERIAPEWWRENGKPFTRDYFRVEDREGHRYWLFREGLYDLEPREPRWFLHGLFA
jgi:hypothetical protein